MIKSIFLAKLPKISGENFPFFQKIVRQISPLGGGGGVCVATSLSTGYSFNGTVQVKSFDLTCVWTVQVLLQYKNEKQKKRLLVISLKRT